jgi:glycosyltransferase involved in cell wall biosynthesis
MTWIGKFRRYKYAHHALLAMPEIIRNVPNAQLVLAGRSDDRGYERFLHRLVAELGLTDCVGFRTNISEEDKLKLLLQSRLLVLPSSVEGFGIVVLEANSCGVPVLASSGVPAGSVRDGFNGLRYPVGDMPALAEQAVRLLTDDDLFERLSDNGRTFVRGFGWATVGEKFEEVVAGAAAGRDLVRQ